MSRGYWRKRAIEAERKIADYENAEHVDRHNLPPEVFFPIYNAGKNAVRKENGDTRELEIVLGGEKMVIPLGNKQKLHDTLRAMDREREALEKKQGVVSQERFDKMKDIAKRAQDALRPKVEQLAERDAELAARDAEIATLKARVEALQNTIMAQPKPRIRITTTGQIIQPAPVVRSQPTGFTKYGKPRKPKHDLSHLTAEEKRKRRAEYMLTYQRERREALRNAA